MSYLYERQRSRNAVFIICVGVIICATALHSVKSYNTIMFKN
jgi:hypothetical protein